MVGQIRANDDGDKGNEQGLHGSLLECPVARMIKTDCFTLISLQCKNDFVGRFLPESSRERVNPGQRATTDLAQPRKPAASA